MLKAEDRSVKALKSVDAGKWRSVQLVDISLSSSCRLQVCELVKFMINHCQQILGEDPSSLFGGPPPRINADEMGPGTETAEILQLIMFEVAAGFKYLTGERKHSCYQSVSCTSIVLLFICHTANICTDELNYIVLRVKKVWPTWVQTNTCEPL